MDGAEACGQCVLVVCSVAVVVVVVAAAAAAVALKKSLCVTAHLPAVAYPCFYPKKINPVPPPHTHTHPPFHCVDGPRVSITINLSITR